jgi:hypothetical protein
MAGAFFPHALASPSKEKQSELAAAATSSE